MRITRLEIYTLTGIRFKRVLRHARGTAGGPDMKAGFHVMLKLFTDEGLVGWGEARTSNPYQGETTWSILAALQRFYAPLLIGRDPWDVDAIHADLDAALPGNPHARSPVDLALHDVLGKATGQPVYKLLGGMHNPRVPLTFAVWLADPDKVVEEVHRVIEETGARYMKVKIGPIDRLAKDVEALSAIRKEFGDSVEFHVDANASYRHAHEAIAALRRIEEYQPALVEQPLPKWDIDGMAEVAAAIDTPIMADEGCWTTHDAFRLLKARAADVLLIKLAKMGGLHPSRQVANVAESAGAPVFLGSNGETGIAAAAGVHFYASTANIWRVTACLFGPYALVHDMVTDATRFRLGKGFVEPPEAPGLGIEVDEDALRHYGEGPIVITE